MKKEWAKKKLKRQDFCGGFIYPKVSREGFTQKWPLADLLFGWSFIPYPESPETQAPFTLTENASLHLFSCFLNGPDLDFISGQLGIQMIN